MKKGVISMSKRKLLPLILAAVLCMLSACGERENQQGADGYVYVPETLDVPLEENATALDKRNTTFWKPLPAPRL